MSSAVDSTLVDHLISLKACCERAVRIEKETLASEELQQLAVSMAVAQIGEVSTRILRKWPEFCDDNPELELVRANATRNRLIHGYDTIDPDTLRDTVRQSIPEMLVVVARILESFAEN